MPLLPSNRAAGLRVALAAAAVLFASGDGPRRPARVRDDLAALQGVWVLKTTEYLGMRADLDPAEDEPYQRSHLLNRARDHVEDRELPIDFREERTTLEFKGNAFTWRDGYVAACNFGCLVRAESTEGTFTLDGGRKPPVMTRRLVASPNPDGERTVYATYSVDGNTLRLGMLFSNDPKHLPARFVTDADDDVVVLTFRREGE